MGLSLFRKPGRREKLEKRTNWLSCGEERRGLVGDQTRALTVRYCGSSFWLVTFTSRGARTGRPAEVLSRQAWHASGAALRHICLQGSAGSAAFGQWEWYESGGIGF